MKKNKQQIWVYWAFFMLCSVFTIWGIFVNIIAAGMAAILASVVLNRIKLLEMERDTGWVRDRIIEREL